MPLKQIRQRKKISQSHLSRVSGVNLKTIQSYEQDIQNINNARIETLLRLALSLDCGIKELITSNELKVLLERYERRNEKC